MSVSANLFQFYNEITSLGPLSGTFRTAQPIQFDQRSRNYGIKLFSMTISSIIPNVYVDLQHGIDTTKLEVSGDAGATWTTVTLIPGYYGVRALREAIITGLIGIGVQDPATAVSDPCVYLGLTGVNQMSYLTIDSSKSIGLVQPGVRFIGNTGELPGFVSTTTFVADGTYAGDAMPLYDYQGSEIAVSTSLPSAQWISRNSGNAVTSGEIARIPIPYVNAGQIVFPSYRTLLSSPVLYAQIPRIFSGFTVKFSNPRTGYEILFSYGHVSASFEIV